MPAPESINKPLAEDLDRILPGKSMSIRLPGLLRWRLERLAKLDRRSEASIIKIALEEYFGPIGTNQQESVDLREYRKSISREAERILEAGGHRPSATAPRGSTVGVKPESCPDPECAPFDFAFSALDDGTWACGNCRKHGTWNAEGVRVSA